MTDLEIFHNAPENASPEELAAYLDEACGGDAELREKVEALFSAEDPADDFLSVVPAPLAEAAKQNVDSLPQPDGQSVLYFGDYELQDEIARGAMGVVYRAEQTSLKRTVAIKMIRSTLLASEEEIARFRTEAEAAASLDHPNIVPIYEIGEHDEQQYFSMKLIEGGTLNCRIERLQKDPKAAARMMRTIALAIHSAHQRGILHRDIKPGNILIDEQGEPHLTDFGLAKQIESENSMTLSGQIMGTPNYMAPEQAGGGTKDLTTAADVYSLGAVFYEMLTGRPPHRGESLMDTLRLVVEEEPSAPRTIDTKIDRDLETIALKCLAKEPGKRYASAQGLANDLDLWLRGEPILARPVGTGEKIAKWMKRKPVHAAAAGLAALLMLTLGIGGPIAALRQAELRERAEQEKDRADQSAALANERNEVAQKTLYASEMHLAQAAEDRRGGALQIQTILDRWRPKNGETDRRGWEWFYLRSRLEQAELNLPHPAQARSAIWSHDGRHIYTGCDDLLIRVWESGTGRLVRVFSDHLDHVHLLALSPDGRYLGSADRSGALRIRDLNTGSLIRTIRTGCAGVDMAWSPDGSAIAHPLDKRSQLATFEIATGKVRSVLDLGIDDRSICWSQNGENIAIGTPNGVIIWNEATGERTDVKFTGGVAQAKFDPGGNLIVLLGTRILVLKPPGFERETSNHGPLFSQSGRQAFRIATSKQSDRLAIATQDRAVLLLNPKTHEIEQEWIGHQGEIRKIERSPDDTRLVTSGQDSIVRVWNASSRRVDPTDSEWVPMARWHPKEDVIAVSQYRRLSFLEGDGFQILNQLELPGGKNRMAFSPDGNRFVVLSRSTGKIHNWRDPNRVLKLPPLDQQIGERFPQWEPKGERLLATQRGLKVEMYSTESGELLQEWPTNSRWDVDHTAWHPQGKRFAMSDYSRIQIRNADTGEIETEWNTGESVTELAWHPSGEVLATARFRDFLVEIWSYPDVRKLTEIPGASMIIRSLAWSPDGALLAIGGDDGEVRLWNLANRQTVLSFEEEGGIYSLDWDASGLRLAVGTVAGLVIRDASRGFLAENSPEALVYLDRKIRATTDDLLPQIRRAELLEKLKRWQDAIAEWEKLEKLRPDEKWISERRLAAILPTMEPETAIAHLESLLEHDPTDSHAARQLARLLFAELPAPEWTVLEVETAQSREGADFATEADGSLFVSSDKGETGDLYTIVTRSELSRVASIRLEAIPDERLPRGRSGRASNGNFRLLGFSLSGLRQELKTAIPVSKSWADYSAGQGNNLARILDEKPQGEWSIGDLTRQRCRAYFDLAEVHAVNLGDRLEISLPNGDNNFHNLGRFRLSVTDRPHAARWAELQQALQAEPVLENGFDLLGIVRSLLDQPEAAAEAFARSLEHAETDRDRNRTRRRANQDGRVKAILNQQ